ncbi:unnamed protein product [Bursaphelenchus xylophilus]|uniref:(pine wood nematode) hypothetical protein n=1 Tax=Bursaphelenchus xylophilus TaxID=6326 RepID=A0A1I7SWW2_BURXY|nr:unnamed protein product [Bursaphelenchus xylophilus]CAG9099999.1 unnamed protein product [Bursaphelenchus xylophilus]
MSVDDDSELIQQLRNNLAHELRLYPEYADDSSLRRWLVGWDYDVEVITPKLREAIRSLHSLGLHKKKFNSTDEVNQYCDSLSKHPSLLPGSVLGCDKEGNVVSMIPLGRLDGYGLLRAAKISDLYLSKIVESEGVMQILRKMEKQKGKQLGTVVIMDLDGLSRDATDITALKVVNNVLARLQDLFPDVLRKAFVINTPNFVQMFYMAISPCLSKQTQQKIEICGSNWKDRLKEVIDEDVLFPHWGGTRRSSQPTGHIRMGGKVAKDHYHSEEDDNDKEKITIPARGYNSVEIEVTSPGSKIEWWFKCDGGDLDFYVERVEEEEESHLVWPKFRLLTQYVPETRTIDAEHPGLYRLVFENYHGKIWSKTVKYYVNVFCDE